ncbi:MAG: DoxX family protein [Bacteroidetes bacterium]|nr:DoxX family protein [Bacteroidota bacterium]
MYNRAIDISLLLLRLAFGGFMILGHGWPKLMKFFSDGPIQFADPLGIGATASLALVVFAEFLCSMLVMLGIFTRLALIPLMITMLVAVFVAKAGQPFNEIEKALMFFIAFAALFISGPGWYSLDGRLRNKI